MWAEGDRVSRVWSWKEVGCVPKSADSLASGDGTV